MSSHLDAFVRVAVVLGLALLAMPLLRRHSAKARRLVLSVALASVLFVPFVPAWHVSAPAYRELVGSVVTDPAVATLEAGIGAASSAGGARSIDWLALVWAVGVVAVLARLVFGLFLARRLARRATPAPLAWAAAIEEAERETGQRAVVRVSHEIEAPAVMGILSPIVLVPASSSSWTNERRRSVLLHELAHVAALDVGVQVLASITCSLHWFNPLVWLAARRLRLERELAADEAVLRTGMRPTTYAQDLLAIAGEAPAGMVAIGEKPLSRRIAAIVAARRPAPLGPKASSALVFATVTIALSVACTTTSSDKATASPVLASPNESELQAMADRELARTVDEWKASGGTILVLTPKGDVVADAGGRSDRPYVAGSTMKPLLLAAAIDEGVVTESDVFDCTRGERGGKVLEDASPLGHVALPEAVARSSNIAFARIFDRLGGARVDRAFKQFHFATPESLASARSGDWDGALVAIGATMSTTPRQVALGYAALANGGDGIVKTDTATRVTKLLEGVVASEHGTGKKARVSGVRVAGKTGTSEWTAPDGSKVTYASFVGYVPSDHPRYVVFVGIESPSGSATWGGNVAAPVFSRVATRLLTASP